MEIVHVSPEVVPFHKVGGLADVAGALPKALRALGHKVTVFSLRYGSVDTNANAGTFVYAHTNAHTSQHAYTEQY